MNSQTYRDWYGGPEYAEPRFSMREPMGVYRAVAQPCQELGCGFRQVFVIEGRTHCAGCGYERLDLAECDCVLPEHHCCACDSAAVIANNNHTTTTH